MKTSDKTTKNESELEAILASLLAGDYVYSQKAEEKVQNAYTQEIKNKEQGK